MEKNQKSKDNGNNNNSISSINERVLTFLKSNPEGVTQEKLTSAIPFNEELIANSLNTLIDLNRITIIESSEGTLFKYRSEKEALKFRDLAKEEIAVYELVMQSGNNGISTNDIKIKMRIDNTTYINRILTKLSKKFLVKSLKVLNTKNKKVWIGYDIEPSQEITGGIWCSNQEFDDNLVNVFSEKCLEYIGSQKQVSRKEILFYAKTMNLTRNAIEIKEDDIQKILNILIFDGKIEPIFPESLDIRYLGNKYSLLLNKNDSAIDLVRYRKIKDFKINSIYEHIPCFLCPAFSECKSDNVVNPIECPYLKDVFINENK